MNGELKQPKKEVQVSKQVIEKTETATKADWERILRRKEERPQLNGFVYKSSKVFIRPQSFRYDDLHG
jgi:hypothetical protein